VFSFFQALWYAHRSGASHLSHWPPAPHFNVRYLARHQYPRLPTRLIALYPNLISTCLSFSSSYSSSLYFQFKATLELATSLRSPPISNRLRTNRFLIPLLNQYLHVFTMETEIPKQEFFIRNLGTKSVTLYPTKAQVVRNINGVSLKVSVFPNHGVELRLTRETSLAPTKLPSLD
jgi:hypothetical protein